jgi:hypothetical protein
VTVDATDVIAPVFTSAEVVVLLFSRVTGQTGLGYFFGRSVLERDDLGRITFFEVGLSGTMTSFAPGYFAFPAAQITQASVGSAQKSFELILVAVLTRCAANVVASVRAGDACFG